jgi:hypothetical protein
MAENFVRKVSGEQSPKKSGEGGFGKVICGVDQPVAFKL